MSGPRFANAAFLDEGVANYGRFLDLLRRHPGSFLVPTYQIDLIWHTHMLGSAAAYAADCSRLAGRFINHDDSVNGGHPACWHHIRLA